MARTYDSGTINRINQETIEFAWIIDIPHTGTLSNGDSYQITDWSEPITFPSGTNNTYSPMSVHVGDIEQDESAGVPTTEVSMTNLTKQISNTLLENDGAVDTEIRMRKIIPTLLKSGTETRDNVWIVDSSSFTRQVAQFQLTTSLDEIQNRMTRTIDHTTFPHISRARTLIR